MIRRVLRGGAFLYDHSFRIADRGRIPPKYRFRDYGFRLAIRGQP